MATPPKTPHDPGKHGRRATDHITASLAGSSTEAAGAPLPASALTNLRTEAVTATTRLGTLAEADEALAALWIRAARQYLGLGEPNGGPVNETPPGN